MIYQVLGKSYDNEGNETDSVVLYESDWAGEIRGFAKGYTRDGNFGGYDMIGAFRVVDGQEGCMQAYWSNTDA